MMNSLAVPVACCVLAVALQATSPTTSCGGQVYKGFDSRLAVEVVGRAPAELGRLVGLEVFQGEVVLAGENGLISFSQDQAPRVAPLEEKLVGIALLSTGTLVLHTKAGLRVLPRNGKATQSRLPDAAMSSIHASGAPVLAVVHRTPSHAQVGLLRLDDTRARPLFTAKNDVRSIEWDRESFTAVTSDRVLRVDTTSGRSTVLDVDGAYARASSVTRVDDQSALVTLDATAVVVAPGYRVIVAGVSGLVRRGESEIYFAEQKSHVVWRLRGVEKLGNRQDDEQHARALLSKSRATGDARLGLEAARIIGCSALK